MKTLKHIALLLLTLVTLSSCEENDDNLYQENWFAKDFEIRSSDWKLVGEPNDIYSYYECVVSGIPLNTSYYDGIVTAYMYFDYDSKYEVQAPLPYTEYIVETNAGGEEVNYSIQYSYDVKSDNTIAFKAYVSDYYTGYFHPGTQYFRVAIIW